MNTEAQHLDPQGPLALIGEKGWQGVRDRIYDLFSEHVLVLIALTLVGAGVGLATMVVSHWWLRSVDDASPEAREDRELLLRRIGLAASFGWTLLIATSYILVNIVPIWVVAGTAATGLAMCACALTQPLSKALRWGWDYAAAWARKRLDSFKQRFKGTDE